MFHIQSSSCELHPMENYTVNSGNNNKRRTNRGNRKKTPNALPLKITLKTAMKISSLLLLSFRRLWLSVRAPKSLFLYRSFTHTHALYFGVLFFFALARLTFGLVYLIFSRIYLHTHRRFDCCFYWKMFRYFCCVSFFHISRVTLEILCMSGCHKL